jgi:hypothetical protein
MRLGTSKVDGKSRGRTKSKKIRSKRLFTAKNTKTKNLFIGKVRYGTECEPNQAQKK